MKCDCLKEEILFKTIDEKGNEIQYSDGSCKYKFMAGEHVYCMKKRIDRKSFNNSIYNMLLNNIKNNYYPELKKLFDLSTSTIICTESNVQKKLAQKHWNESRMIDQ